MYSGVVQVCMNGFQWTPVLAGVVHEPGVSPDTPLSTQTRRHVWGLGLAPPWSQMSDEAPKALGLSQARNDHFFFDKERPGLTSHLNEGHVVDMAELNDAPDGTSRLNELKVYSGLSKHYDGGRGSTLNGGTPTSVGHLYACGNTEERLRLGNLGCAERGHPSHGAFDHSTGRGWVHERRGCYHDGIFNKRNATDLLLHETLGGGFSPPAVAKICRLGRKVKQGACDRTRYTSRRPISYVNHHAQRISLSILKADAAGIIAASRQLSATIASPESASGSAVPAPPVFESFVRAAVESASAVPAAPNAMPAAPHVFASAVPPAAPPVPAA